MYNFTKNKETKEIQVTREMMNCHPSIIDKKTFDEVFSREYARHEYFGLYAKMMNDTASSEDIAKLNLLQDEFGFTNEFDTRTSTSFDGLNSELRGLMTLTLFAHGKLLDKFTCKDNTYKIVTPRISLGLNDFYATAKKIVKSIDSGTLTIEKAVDELKPFYNNACDIINHEAVDGVCKKWEESTKAKMTRAFVVGLTSTYKLVRINKIKKDSPTKSQMTFEKYFAMWLVTNGELVQNTGKTEKIVENIDSFANRQ